MNKARREKLAEDCAARKEALEFRTEVPPNETQVIVTKNGGFVSTPPKPKKAHVEKGRLPDRSSYWFTYDAEKQQWAGVLVIGDGLKRFEDTHSAIFKLLSRLDDAYRKTLSPSEKLEAL